MMDAVILAGGICGPDNPIYPSCKGGYKAMLDIGGKPMVQWILDALEGSKIEHVFLIGLPKDVPLHFGRGFTLLADQGGIVPNICSGARAAFDLRKDPDARILTISGDIPGITSEMVNWTIDQVESSDYDIYYSVVENKVMENRFPGSRRSYVYFNDHTVCGADLNSVRIRTALNPPPIFEKLTASRKNAIRQAGIIGFDILFSLLIRQLKLHDAERKICQRLQIRGKLLVSPYAEVGMDVDKPFQLDIMREFLTRN